VATRSCIATTLRRAQRRRSPAREAGLDRACARRPARGRPPWRGRTLQSLIDW
jgi:hypothetical protein